MPAISGIHHVALTVTDLDVSVPFYERLWGAPPAGELTGETFQRRVFRPVPGLTLGLTQHDDGDGSWFDPTRVGLDHVGFACADRAAVVAWAEHLDTVGIAHSDIVDAPYGTALSFKDPDGIALEFYTSIMPTGL